MRVVSVTYRITRLSNYGIYQPRGGAVSVTYRITRLSNSV